MKTLVLKAYNQYVVLANRYRHEKPLQLERVKQSQVEKDNNRYSPELWTQDHHLTREARILFEQVQLAHFNLTEAIGGFEPGTHQISLPATYEYGELIVAPRYQNALDEAVREGWEEVDVPTNFVIAVANDDGFGTPLVYRYDPTFFRDSMPYKLRKPTPQFS